MSDKAKNDLENIVEVSPRVYVLSELGYDADYFNASAYENLLRLMESDKDITGVIVDGALTRLDRPEFLNDKLTYWNKSEDECKEICDTVPNRDQYKNMMGCQLEIVESRLKELRERVPHAKVVFSLDGDDVQYTISAMLNEMLVRGKLNIGESINKLKTKKNELKKKQKDFQKGYDGMQSDNTSGRERGSVKRKIGTCNTKIDNIEDKLQDLYEEQKLYREKKVRPSHQHFTRKFIEEFHGMYSELCQKYDVELVTNQTLLDFDGLVIDYAHSRHKTGNVIKTRDKRLVKSLHGMYDKLKGIDVILESGHFGIGFKQLQKLRDHPDESNFRNQSSYDPNSFDDHVTVVMCLPFEDQSAVGDYVKGRQPFRMSGGKPVNTRKIAATDRYNNGGVSGLTIIGKTSEGNVRTEWVQYNNFIDGSVLQQPEEYSIICLSSDEHLGSPESSPIVIDGWVDCYIELLENSEKFRGKPAYAKGYINAGDAAEANSKKWDHRYHQKRSPFDLIRENIDMLKDFRPDSVDEVVSMAMKMTNDAMGGSIENMSVILGMVADYFDKMTIPALGHSSLKWVHASTTGNHADNVLRDLGMRESDHFLQRMLGRGVSVCESGNPNYLSDDVGARIFLGGYSSARLLNIPDYGLGVDGNPMFGPINLIVQHDPSGSDMNAVIGEGRNAGADLSIAGHTHENKLKLYLTDENSFSVAYRSATLQGVSPTEKKYAYSVPRTQAAQKIIMPMKGDFTEEALPASYLRRRGIDVIRKRAGKL
ncbi:hypothetical protein HQ545_02755 [Candidatus Woesearchaeota archaeon]|nr:hypothetical protein [Candidatus Woesearchaeota archaeon]